MENMCYHQRRANRLRSWDYSAPGAYFLTVCTLEKQCILSRITVGGGVLDAPQSVLTADGKIVEKTLFSIIGHYPALSLDNYVIMPNHIHLLLSVSNDGASRTPLSDVPAASPLSNDGASRTPPPTNAANAVVPSFISTLKRFTNKACGKPLWQRSYHDHVIRDERDYREIWQYIDNNPARWAEDRYAPQY